MKLFKSLALASACWLPLVSQAAVIDFHFTGNILVATPDGGGGYSTISNGVDSNGNPVELTPIAATLSFDTVNGIGSSDLSITMPDFIQAPATFHDITLENIGGNQIAGKILVDWSGNYNMPLNINWDATGLFNAIDIGLSVGDTISGSTLKQDTTGDGAFDTFTNVFSAAPFSDSLLFNTDPEGPAPLAATSSSLGLGYDIDGTYIGGTPFDGIVGLINIGSGNSLTVTGVSVVPVPAAIWLFGSGLLGLAGMARRRRYCR